MKPMKRMILIAALWLLSLSAPAHAACPLPISSTASGDYGYLFDRLTEDDAVRLARRFQVLVQQPGIDLTSDDHLNPWNYAFIPDFTGRYSRYRRLINALQLIDQVPYDRDDFDSWGDRLVDADVPVIRLLDCGTLNALYDCSSDMMRLTDSLLLSSDVLTRAAVVLHEARHRIKDHNTKHCMSNGERKIADPDFDAYGSCDSHWDYEGANTEAVRFVISASKRRWLLPNSSFLEAGRVYANDLLQKRFESDPGFRLKTTSTGTFERRYWDCTTDNGLFQCPDSGLLDKVRLGTDKPTEVESAFFRDPDFDNIVIIGIGVSNIDTDGRRTGDITTIKVYWRSVLTSGRLGPVNIHYFGRNPQEHAGIVEVLLPRTYWSNRQRVITGLVVSASSYRIRSLGVRFRIYDESVGYLTGAEEIEWANSNHTSNQINLRVAPNHVLTGLGLTMTYGRMANVAFNQRAPLNTIRTGGKGGTQQLVRCPGSTVAVGIVANNRPSGYREVRFFALQCANLRDLRRGVTRVTRYVYGSFHNDQLGRRVQQGSTSTLSSASIPSNVVSMRCDAGQALRGVNVYSGALIDRIRSIECRSMTISTSRTVFRKTVNVGGTGGNYTRLSCGILSDRSTIDGMLIRAAASLDALSFHCRDRF